MSSSTEDSGRSTRLWEVLQDVLQKRHRGESIPSQAVVEQHPELAPELEQYLARAERISDARTNHKQPKRDAVPIEYLEQLPRDFANYRLQSLVSRGGMGAVYRATQKGTNREVAIKMIRDQELADEQAVARFCKEGSAAAQLNHPNIVTVFETGEHLGQYFYSMEFIEGESLAERISRLPLPGDLAVEVLIPIVDAVAYAHEQGVVHRDLKPSNVILDNRQNPLITDFGLAKQINDDTKTTQTGQVIGTASYMSPEQAIGKHDLIDHRSDIYGLGAMLYEMLTRRPPFSAESIPETLLQVLRDNPLSLRSLNRNIHRDLETICLKCLDKKPSRRYASAQDLKSDLECWRAGTPIRARRISAFGKLVRWARRESSLAIALGVAGMLLLSLLGALAWGNWATSLALQREATAMRFWQLQHERANRSFVKAERSLYITHMNLAQRAWQNGNINYVLNVLDRYRDLEGSEDYRGFEWHYLWRLTHLEQASIVTTEDWHAMACSPDGKLIVVGSSSGRICLFDTAQRRCLSAIQAHGEEVSSIVFSPSGDRFATTSYDGTVQVRNTESTQQIARFDGHSLSPEGAVNDVIFFGDERIATVGRDRTLRIWSLEQGEEAQRFEAYPDRLNGVAYSQVDRWFFTSCRDGSVGVRNFDTGEIIASLQGHQQYGTDLAFLPGSRQLVSGDGRGDIFVWDLETFQPLQHLQYHDAGINAFASSPDGSLLAAASTDGSITIFDVSDWQPILRRKGHRGSVVGVAFATNNQLVSASRDGTIRIWAVQGRFDDELPGHGNTVWSIQTSPDGRLLASGGSDGRTCIWELDSMSLLQAWPQEGEVDSVDFSSDSRNVVTGCDDQVVRVFDVSTAECTHEFKGHTDHIICAKFVPNSDFVVSTSRDGTVRLWSLSSTDVNQTITVQPPGFLQVAVAPSGNTFVTGSDDGSVRTWDLSTRTILHENKRHSDQVLSIAFSADGTQFVSTGRDGKAIVWNADDHRVIHSMETDIVKCRCATFSPDGKVLVTGGGDKHVKLWDLATGDLRGMYQSHDNGIYAVAFTPDGASLISACGGTDSKIVIRRTE